MRIAWIPRTTDASVASTRIRCLSVIDNLRMLGVQGGLYEASAFDHYDAAVFVKAYGEEEIKLAYRFQKCGKKVILDLCDNHFLMKDSSSSERGRVESLKVMVAVADAIVVSTEELRKVVLQHHGGCESRIVVIGDAVEKSLPPSPFIRRPVEWLCALLLRMTLCWHNIHGRRRLVWFGIHGGDNAEYGMSDLKTVAAALNAVNRETPLSLTVISNNYVKFREVSHSFEFPTVYMPWGSTTFFSILRRHELVLIPVALNDFTRCKSNNRLALSLDQGLPVVASSMPAYLEFSECVRLDEWKDGVREYLGNPLRAIRDVKRGQEIIQQRYSIDSIGRQWLEVLGKVLKG